jgi:hypothetical protein
VTTHTNSKATVHDDAKRLIELVCNSLQAVNQVAVGEYLTNTVAGSGRLFMRRGPHFVFTITAELAMREIVGLCTTKMPDDDRRTRCMAILRRLEARPA